MCGAFRGHDQNRIAPVTDLTSERIEIRKGRWLRVVHYKPRLSTSGDSGFSREDTQSAHSLNSISSTATAADPDYKKIVVIFFIHGVGGSADLWYEQLKYFCKAGYEVVAPDLLGHGQSSTPRSPADYQFSELSYDLIYLFDRFHKKRNVLVGHSYGASFCSVIASERARLVSKMVLIAGGGPVPLVGVDSCDVFCLPTPVLSCIKPVFLSVYERRAYNSQRARSLKRKVKAFSAPPFVLKAVMAGQRWEEGDEAFHQELMVPALLIYGAQDKFVTLEEEQWMEEVIYSSSLEIIQEAGHMVMVESPVRVNWLIHNFLQRDVTTRSLHHQSVDLSSKGSIHVTRNDGANVTQGDSEPLQTVSESCNEEARRCSSEMTLQEPLDKSLKNVRRASLSVPEKFGHARRYSGDSIEAIDILQQGSPEICLEIPQAHGDKSRNTSTVYNEDNTMQASEIDSKIRYSDNTLLKDEKKTKGNVNDLATASLSPTLGAVHIMRPLAGIAWTQNATNDRAKSRSSLRSFLRPKTQTVNEVGSKSAPPSPVTSRST